MPITDHPLPSQNSTAAFSRLLLEENNLWKGFDITTRVFADGLPPAQLTVELHPVKAAPLPEVLAYWHETSILNDPQTLNKAALLGALAGGQARRWLLPESALHNDGYLVLFSPPHQAIVAEAFLPVSQFLPKGGK